MNEEQIGYCLFLDDTRKEPEGWILAKNYDEFISIIKSKGLPKHVSFDHDLAEEHQEKKINYDACKEKTGYHCAIWLVSHCLENKYDLPSYAVHSQNPTGKRAILKYLSTWPRMKLIYDT